MRLTPLDGGIGTSRSLCSLNEGVRIMRFTTLLQL